MNDQNRIRYRELVATVQSTGTLWIAESEDAPLILEDMSGDELILVWPTAEAARETLSQRPELSSFVPVSRALDRWLGTSSVHLMEDGVLVAAHPDATLNCLKAPARDFARDLRQLPHLQGQDIARIKRRVAKKSPRDQ